MRSFYLLFVVFSANVLYVSAQCQINNYFIIRNQPSGLVLQADDTAVTLQYFTGYDAQLWKFECSGAPGVYNILSKHLFNAPVLDVQTSDNETLVFLNSQRDQKSDSQQWFVNSDGTIANVDSQLFLDVLVQGEDGKVAVGNSLDVVPLSGEDNQKFLLQPKA